MISICMCIYSNSIHYILDLLPTYVGQKALLKAAVKKNSLPSRSLLYNEECK